LQIRAIVLPGILLLLGVLFVAACSGDDDDDNGGASQVTQTQPPAGDDGNGDDSGSGNGAPAGGGQAVLTIGSDSWAFERVYCAFTPEEAGNESISLSAGSFGESPQGVRLQLDVSIYDPDEEGRYEGSGVIHSISLDDIEDFANPSVGWSATSGFFGMGELFIQVDGKQVTAQTTFDDSLTDEIEEVPGTLDLTCP
jgi:hypothetical protein